MFSILQNFVPGLCSGMCEHTNIVVFVLPYEITCISNVHSFTPVIFYVIR